MTTDGNDLLLGAILSLIFPGLGHLVVGRTERALHWIIATFIFYFASFVLVGFILLLFAPLLHIAAVADVLYGY